MKLYLTFYDRQSTLTKSPAEPTKAIDAVLTVPMAFLHLELRQSLGSTTPLRVIFQARLGK